MSPLKIVTRDATTGPVLEVVGDLDFAHAPALRERISTLVVPPGRRLVLDLGGLEFCDSSGITALIAAHSHAQAARAEVVLASVPANTLRILQMVGLDQVFTVQPDSDAATRT
ncbi:anti-anti-sigma factor [Streptomyces longwoodensis]|uniref:Anti-sigma factor antagonist n=1 Tax=Streptomyces longwoodensis TaxID=68231 RepID=A0A101R3I8_9ACTN|nr:STAS domain-containing protein [Streptomyces longwoodensis]KUN41017.1 anti-anti-sigma factor [Streptomyces longwoodensis]